MYSYFEADIIQIMHSFKQTVESIRNMKSTGEKIVALTAYDYPMAQILSQSQVDLILVGDTLGVVVLGYDTTSKVTVSDIVHHTKAVARGNDFCLIVADLPYGSYTTEKLAIENAKLLISAGADAVKLEGCYPKITESLTQHNIPTVGHIGLLPQTADKFRVYGRSVQEAELISQQAKQLESSGCFALVLESITKKLASKITKSLNIPTIGIGAGSDCDGQILVLNDMLGLFDLFKPTFVKHYAELGITIKDAIANYKREVRENIFPDSNHTYE